MEMVQLSYIFGVPNRIMPGTAQIRGHICRQVSYSALISQIQHRAGRRDIAFIFAHRSLDLYNTACNKLTQMRTRARVRRVTPLGRPRSVYKSDVECRFLEFWVEMVRWSWRSRSMTPILNTSKQTQFPRIRSENGQYDLESPGQCPPFSIPNEGIPWCMFGTTFGDLKPNLWRVTRGEVEFPIIQNQGQWPPFQ